MRFDRALGFAPPNRTSAAYFGSFDRGTKSHPNFLHQLTESGAMEHDIMTLRLPRTMGAKGNITLGEDAPPIKHRIPLSPNSTSTDGEGWKVDLSSVLFDGLPDPLELQLETIAEVSLAPDFTIALPLEIVKAIYDYLGAEESEFVPGGVIDCDARETLPDLTLTLGGQTITFGWKEYTGVWRYGGSEKFCVVEIQTYSRDPHSAALGLSLMYKFDMSFDMGRNEIGCKFTL